MESEKVERVTFNNSFKMFFYEREQINKISTCET